jgi:catechol 2,3-dioxygenase-like lactoylglutathione lyase family enzyme
MTAASWSIDHVSVGVSDLHRAAAFYDAVFATLGCRRTYEVEAVAIAYGKTDPEFWIAPPLDTSRPASGGNGTHVGFHAKDHAAVDAFYAAALANGGKDAGPPGLRPDYGPSYYGAFALDPDGNKIEACYRDPA